MEDNEKMTLATELLHEIKASAKRWFIAFLVMCGIELATIAGFMWYLTLPSEEFIVDQDTGAGGDNYNIGGNYGTPTYQLQEAE